MAKTTARHPGREADRLGRGHDLRPARRRHQRHHGGAAEAPGARSASSRCGTRRRRPSWPAATPSSPGGSASASPPRGPGGIHLLNGLYDAKMDGQPVLAITGHTYHDLIGTHYQQDVDLDKLFMDVAVYNAAGHGRRRTSRTSPTSPAARRSAAAGVAHITFPNDIQEHGRRTSASPSATSPAHTLRASTPPRRRCPPARTLQRAAEILNAGKKVAILAGRGALGAGRRARAARRARSARRSSRPLLGKARGAGRQPLHHRRHRPARHRAVAGGDGGVRHAADRRQLASPTSSSCPSRARRAACRSTSTRRASACAIRSRSAWSATAGRRSSELLPLLQRNEDRALPGEGAGGHEGVVGADGGARHARRTCR